MEKFKIGDIVKVNKQKGKNCFRIVGVTEYSRRDKDGQIHEPVYMLEDADTPEINSCYMVGECREHLLTMLYKKHKNDIEITEFKFNLGDFVILKEGGVVYEITSRTKWKINKFRTTTEEPNYELRRTTDNGKVYFEHFKEQYILRKVDQNYSPAKENISIKKKQIETLKKKIKKLENDIEDLKKEG